MGGSVSIKSVEEIMAEIRNELTLEQEEELNDDVSINIEEIMDEIRLEIATKGFSDNDITISDIPVRSVAPTSIEAFPLGDIGISSRLSALKSNLEVLSTRYNVPAYRTLRSHRVLGPIIIFFKKIIRKCSKFYIEPIVFDQNENNRMIVVCLKDLTLEIEDISRKLKD